MGTYMPQLLFVKTNTYKVLAQTSVLAQTAQFA
nr:MAG TPA: hypothetical protein [Caudoviricetes sp.]